MTGNSIQPHVYMYMYTIFNLTRNGCLHWHSDVIPPNEIWLKVGCDKGGKSFKMSFQIVNTRSPNSPSNTCAFSIFEASDSVTNLKVVANRFGEDIGKLEKQTWK